MTGMLPALVDGDYPEPPRDDEHDAADGECATCGELAGTEDECPKSKRPCGHHCNHSWTHDSCCWCGESFVYDGPDLAELLGPPELADEAADRRDEARQAHVDACGCRACDPGWWADEDQFERSREDGPEHWPDDELPGMWELADFTGGLDEERP